MIILITGTPGSGKTLYTVAELLNKKFKGRPLFVNGIPNLLIEHEVISDEDVEKWFKGGVSIPQPTTINNDTGEIVQHPDKPAFDVKNAVFCIDEVQRIARTRSASAPVPEWIKQLEVHRHFGCDFIIITQHPQQMDAHIRRLVGRHLHVRRTFALGAAVVYEWDSVNNLSGFKNAQSKIWRYPKDAFKLYKSSELHTKAGGRVPLVVWVLLAAVLAFPFVGYSTLQRMMYKFSDDGKNVATPPSMIATNGKPGAQKSGGEKPPMTRQQYIDQFEPRLEGQMHTAPAYDQLTAVKIVPLPAACIESFKPSWVKQHGGPCGCYTQTGTPYETTQSMCAQFVRNKVFFPFVELASAKVEAPPAPVQKTPPAANPEASPVFINAQPLLPPPDTKSTIERDAQLVAFAKKREYIK